MAQSALIIGDSGCGKSTSVESLDPSSTFIINVANKPLPFKGWKAKYTPWSKTNLTGNMYIKSDADSIISCLQYISIQRPEIKTVVIDDWQYMSAFEYMEKAMEKGYDKFTKMSMNLTRVARIQNDLRDDLIIFFLTHSEDSVDIDGNRKVKAKTIGKMIDTTLTLEGLFSIVLFAKAKKDKEKGIKYVFETQTNGENTCKTPKGMFLETEIPNDLNLVRTAIIDYEN
jgi:predicted ATP-dependent serine protease